MAAEASPAGNSFGEATMEQRNNVDIECTLRRSLRPFPSPALAFTGMAMPSMCSPGATTLRTSVNLREHTLTPVNVSPPLRQTVTLYADGQIVAQQHVSGFAVDTAGNPNTPLVQGTFNAVLVATMHNTVYLYDADHERPGPQGRTVPLWATWLGQPRPSGKDIDMWSTSDPEWGILSTPVIDAAKSVVYLVAWHDDGAQGYRYRIHALPSRMAARHFQRSNFRRRAWTPAPEAARRTSAGRRRDYGVSAAMAARDSAGSRRDESATTSRGM
jgi:hypothetical protein